MDNKYSPSITQTNEASYRTINYPNINTLSFIQSINNNKNNLFDEDDTKNNENFVTFLDNLLNKEESTKYLETENFQNEDNSSTHSNKIFFLKKINTKNNIKNYKINNNKKEEEIYYSFRNNKIKNKSFSKINNDFFPFQYRLKNFMISIPKKSRQQIIYNKNINTFDYQNNILYAYNTEKKSVGINCQINDYFLNEPKKANNESDDINKLGNNLSLKQIDGRMLNKYNNYDKSYKKTKKIKNNKKSLNHIIKFFPDNKIPKIIFYSRNNYIKDREEKHKLNTMKENVMHFLKDKSHYSITKKHSSNTNNNVRNINDKNHLNKIGKNFPSKISYNLFSKIKLIYGNEKNLISYLKSFEKNYKKNINIKKLNLNNKKKIFSSLKNKIYYNNK